MVSCYKNTQLDNLIQDIRKGDVILWVGSGFSKNSGYPMGSQLTDIIKNKLSPQERKAIGNRSNLEDVAEEFVLLRSRNDLLDVIQDIFKKEPSNIKNQEMVRDIPQIRHIITTNYDQLFELAYGDAVYKVLHDEDIPGISSSDKVVLYKIHGDIDDRNSILITKDDYLEFYEKGKDRLIWTQIKSLISQYSILFIGYSFEDGNIRYIFDDVIEKLNGDHKSIYLISPNIPPYKIKYLTEKYSICYINSSAEKIMPKLFRVIHRYLKEDMETGKLSPEIFGEILQKQSIDSKIVVANGKPRLKSIGSKNNRYAVKGKLKIKFPPHSKELIKSFDELVRGKYFGSITLSPPQAEICLEDLSILGIDLVGSDSQISELKVVSCPSEIIDVDLILKSSGLQYHTACNIYRSGSCSKIEIVHPQFTLAISLVDINRRLFSFNISIDNTKSVSEEYQVYNFFKQWMNDTLLIFIQNGTKPLSINFNQVNMSLEDVDRINCGYNLFSALFQIQNTFGVYFDAISELTETDIQNIFYLKNLIDGKPIMIDSLSADEAVISDINTFENIMQNGAGVIKLSQIQEKQVTILNKAITVPCSTIYVYDAVIVNRSDVRITKGDESCYVTNKIELGSKSGNMYIKYDTQKGASQ